MSDQNNTPTSEFLKGFNYGYIIEEHKPDLASSLKNTKFPDSEKEYATGLLSGMKQRQFELTKDKWRNAGKDKDRENDKEPDMER